MTARALIVMVFLAGAPVAAAPSSPSSARSSSQAVDEGEAARELLRQAIDLYVVGRYREAAERLRPLVETRVLRDRADQAEALRAYGISLFLVGGRPGAERAFRDLLRLEPGARMDPAFVRPEVVRFFEEVRRRHRAEQDELRRRSSSAAPNLLPPWGQLRNGHRKKAYVILGGELGLTTLSLTTFGLLTAWGGETGEFRGHEGAYSPLVAINWASTIALAVLFVYGVVDGFVYYYRALPHPAETMGPANPNRVVRSPGLGLQF